MPKSIKIGRTLTAVIHEAEEGGFWAEVPALPGCYSQGETREEMEDNIRESAAAWLEARMEAEADAKMPVPPVPSARAWAVEIAV